MSTNEGEGFRGEQPKKIATMAQAKAMVRRKLRKHPEHMEMGLNIYPLMDVMTILLVFLIMGFASESANLTQSEELRMPASISTTKAEMAVPIQISRSDIVVDGRRVTALRNGMVDASQKQGGANGFVITPLLNAMKQHAERLKMIASRNPRRPFDGTVQIIADYRTPYRTLTELMYTLGQAEFSKMRFVVLENSNDPTVSRTAGGGAH